MTAPANPVPPARPPHQAIPSGPVDTAPETSDAGDRSRYCVRHPDRETLVSCGRCGRPFCPECLLHTAAGQRCYECAGVRRDAVQRALARRVLQSAGIMAIGAAIASFMGLFGLFVAAFAGSMAGQTLSPAINRRTRRWMYPLALATLFAGTLTGWSLVVAFRILTAAGGRPVPLSFYAAIPFALLENLSFWLFFVIAVALAYQRAR